MHDSSLTGGPVQDRTVQMGPVAEVLFGDNDGVDGNAEGTNQVRQSNHLSPRIGESALDDKQIQILVRFGQIAAFQRCKNLRQGLTFDSRILAGMIKSYFV